MSLATETAQTAAAAIADQLKSLDKTHVGAAMSKLISASIGDAVVVMSKSPAYKFHTLADIEWLVMPAVLTGQIYVAEVQHVYQGLRAPVACVIWASVSDEVAKRLTSTLDARVRLQPHEWNSGPHLWLIYTIGEPAALGAALNALADTAFQGKRVNVESRTTSGELKIEDLHDLLRLQPIKSPSTEQQNSEPARI